MAQPNQNANAAGSTGTYAETGAAASLVFSGAVIVTRTLPDPGWSRGLRIGPDPRSSTGTRIGPDPGRSFGSR